MRMSFFESGDYVSFKEEGKQKWPGPAKVIAVDGKVLIIKYGSNTRRVHKTKAVKTGNEFATSLNGEKEGAVDDTSENKNPEPEGEDRSSKDKSSEANVEEVDANKNNCNEEQLVDEEDTGDEKEAEVKLKRKTSLRRPEIKRRIQFKR